MPALRRVLFPLIAKLSPASRKLGLTDAHNGLRVFDRAVADGLNLTMNGMAHASEIVALIVENGWRVAEEPVEILYTDYSKSKGQPLVNGVNIIFDGLLRGEDAPMNWIQVLLIVAIVVLLVYLLRSRRSAQSKAWVKVGYVLFVVAAVYAIVRPNDTTVVANWLGVARGADLLEYALIVAFLFTTISTYMRFKDLELRYAQLARAVALEGARDPPSGSSQS